jgi:hypothetical protein
MTVPKVLVKAPSRAKQLVPDVERSWRWVGWFSLVLAIAGLGDWVIAWIPFRFGSTEWEFGTIVSTFSGLPLVTMGFAGLLASAVARGVRWQIVTVSTVVLLFALFVLGASVIFLLDVPVALQAVGGIARLGILKAIAKTALLGSLFFTLYLIAGVGGLRYSLSRQTDAL